MANDHDNRHRNERQAGGRNAADVDAIELEDAPSGDLEAAMRDALAAVEAVEDGGNPANPASSANFQDAAISTDPPGPGAGPGGSPSDDVTRLRREIADLRDRSMRTLADFDNYRKRAERERQEVRRYALLEPLREILPIADNLERALEASGSADDLKRGVEMILRQLHELLRRLGVREVPAAGEAFDPALHEAVSRQESSDVQAPTVAETLVRGYQLHDKLLRPAMVKVAVPAEEPAAARDGSSGRGESPR
jgi:molecular chaperone GrpE